MNPDIQESKLHRFFSPKLVSIAVIIVMIVAWNLFLNSWTTRVYEFDFRADGSCWTLYYDIPNHIYGELDKPLTEWKAMGNTYNEKTPTCANGV